MNTKKGHCYFHRQSWFEIIVLTVIDDSSFDCTAILPTHILC